MIARIDTCRNQSAHYLVSYEHFWRGTTLPQYKTLSRRFAIRFVDGVTKAGYQVEAGGIDASYIGMTHWHMGEYWRLSKDPQMRLAVRNSYRFFNHTVGREPNGRILGGFNFNHRVAMGFFAEQYEGARRSMQAELPEVGLHVLNTGKKRVALAAARRYIVSNLGKIIKGWRGTFGPSQWQAWAEPNRGGTLPAEEKASFIRNFANELIAVKRPNYYLVVYVGKPVSPFYIRDRKYFRMPLKGNAESNAGIAPSKPATPFLGGGLSLFWTKDYGCAMAGTNWSPYAQHGIVAVDTKGRRWWADYHAQKHKLDAKKGTLLSTGRIENRSIYYERRYRFLDDRVEVSLKLTAIRAEKLKDLVEVIPLCFGRQKDKSSIIVLPGEKANRTTATGFHVINAAGHGVRFEFDGRTPLRVSRKGMRDQYSIIQVHRVEVELKTELTAGETTSLRYVIRPFRRPGSARRTPIVGWAGPPRRSAIPRAR